MAVTEPSAVLSWPQRYARLLASAGLDHDTELEGALQTQDTNRTALFSLGQALEQPQLLIQQVRDEYPGAPGERVVTARLSVLHQDLALNIIAPLTLRLFLHGEAPLPDPDRIFLASSSPDKEPSSRWFLAGTAAPVGVPEYISGLEERVNHWYPIFRHALGVSPGAYWSSVGLGLGAPFSVVWNRAEPATTCQLAQAWLKQFECDANRFIDWIPAEFSEQTCAIPQRKGCCLKYLLPDGGYCGTCGVYRKERMALARRHPTWNPAPEGWPGRE